MWCFRASVATSEFCCRFLPYVFRHAVISYCCQDCMAYRPQPRLFADSGSLKKGTENDEEPRCGWPVCVIAHRSQCVRSKRIETVQTGSSQILRAIRRNERAIFSNAGRPSRRLATLLETNADKSCGVMGSFPLSTNQKMTRGRRDIKGDEYSFTVYLLHELPGAVATSSFTFDATRSTALLSLHGKAAARLQARIRAALEPYFKCTLGLTIKGARPNVYIAPSRSRWFPLLCLFGASHPSVGHTQPSKLVLTVSGTFRHELALGRMF